MFRNLVIVELRKLSARALLWVELSVLALLVGSMYVALIATLQKGSASTLPPQAVESLRQMLYWPQALNDAMVLAGGGELGGMLAVILVGAFMAQEYTWHTIHQQLSQGVSRSHFLLAKFVVVSMALGLIVLTALLAGGVVTAVFTYLDLGIRSLRKPAMGTLLFNVLRICLTLLPYAALTSFLAVASRSAMVAIGVGLGYSLLVENLVIKTLSMISPQIARAVRFLPAMLAQSIVQQVSPTVQVDVGLQTSSRLPLLGPNEAALMLTVYTVVFLVLAVWWFRRQDVTV